MVVFKSSFLAWFAIIAELHNENKLQYFTSVRKSVETLIANFPIATTETVGKFGSGIKGYDRLQIVYKAFIKISSKVDIDFDDELNLNTIILALSKSFDYLNFNEHLEAGFHGIRDEQAIKDIVAYVQKLKPDERPKSHKFSLTTKTILHDKNLIFIIRIFVVYVTVFYILLRQKLIIVLRCHWGKVI
jgi:hypothetical protein